LAQAVDVEKQPPSFLISVGEVLGQPFVGEILGMPAGSAFLRRIQRAYPADLWANVALARWLTDNGLPAEAVRYYTAALALRPKNPGIYLNRSQALEYAGEMEAAIADLHRALALAPEYVGAHINLGNLLRGQGELDEAMAEYREALRLKKDSAEAHLNLGLALQD
jgi:tetratricopeptide (TPR) repeat protein